MADYPGLGPGSYSKPALDVGFQTNQAPKLLAWYNSEFSIKEAGPPMKFDGGMTQFRLPWGHSIIKINQNDTKLESGVPGGFEELYLAQDGVSRVETKIDPDGNKITVVPKGYLGIESVGFKVKVRSFDKECKFWKDTMGCVELSPGRFRAASTVIIVEEDSNAKPAGNWGTSLGFRYITFHVMRVDKAFNEMVKNGAEVEQKLRSMGKMVRIGFVKDTDGNVIEIAQRADLAGATWAADKSKI